MKDKMVTLHFIHCKKCKKDYLVGIDGKDITKSKTSGGKDYMAIGNEEVKEAPIIQIKVPCKNCGEMCKVEEGKNER